LRNGTEKSKGRGRGRPAGYDRAEVLARIAATFRRHGYEGTSLDRLAAETGLARPSLYAGFGDKRDMYLAAVAATARLLEEGVTAALAQSTLRGALGALYDRAIALYAGGPVQLGCLIVCTATTAAPDEPTVREALAEVIAGLDAALVARCAAAPAECRGDPAGAGAVAAATIHSLAVRARAGAPRAELVAVAAAAVELICL
jgi:AcrR family transcriptional regulator